MLRGEVPRVARENERMRSRGYNWVRERWDAGWPVGGTKKKENGKGEEEMATGKLGRIRFVGLLFFLREWVLSSNNNGEMKSPSDDR